MDRFISGSRNCKNGEVSGSRRKKKERFLDPEIVKMVDRSYIEDKFEFRGTNSEMFLHPYHIVILT